jgi:hypothetical protein
MIEKKRTIPIHLQQLDALLRRIPKDHPKQKRISEDFSKRMAGYHGEQSIDYHLSFLSKQNYTILHDIRLYDGSHYFQLDTLILTTKFALFLEVKNIAGTLLFDSEFNQLVRISNNGKPEGLPNPMLQIYRQQLQLRKIVPHNLPIESLVVISNPRTLIKSTSNETPTNVIHSANLIKRISELNAIYKEDILSTTSWNKLANYILCSHRPLKVDILKSYDLTVSDLITGVQCPNCANFSMTRTRKSWKCPTCNFTFPNAHIQALKDYALLVQISVKNQHVRDFLHLTSLTTVKTLLQRLNFPHEGKCKGRTYKLIFEDD